MGPISAHLRKPPLAQLCLLAVLAFCSFVDMPIRLKLPGISGLGAGTFAIAGLVWVLFLIRPSLPTHVLKTIFLLGLFEIYSAGSLLWAHTGTDGVQLLVVGIAFLGLIVVCAREAGFDPENGQAISRMLLGCSAVAVVTYWYVAYKEPRLGEGTDDIINPRPFALYALTVVAVALSRWRNWNLPTKSWLLPLAWAAATTFTVALSMSRTALVCCAALFPLALLLRLNFKSLVQAVMVLLAGAALFAFALIANKQLYDRFFGGDAAVRMGGVSFNTSGRSQIWEFLLRSIGDDWIFGKGIAASEVWVKGRFGRQNIVQPHNDYLRYYFDTGVVGLALWLCFAAAFYFRTSANLRRSVREQTPDYPLHLAALLAFSAVSFSMLTDNSVCYSFVMMPLGVVIGCSLGAGRSHLPLDQSESLEMVYPEPMAQPLPRRIRIVS